MINDQAYALGANRSSIRELFEYGRARARIVGEDRVYDYSLGNPSIPAPAELAQAIRDILSQRDPLSVHGYTSAAGDYAAREAIAADLNQRFSGDVLPEELFLTCGAAPALTAVFRAITRPGEELLAIAPFFPEYRVFAQTAGALFRVVPPDVPDFQIRLDKLEAMLTPGTAALILNSPNNPSGTVYSRKTLEALAGLLTRKSQEFGHPIYIVSDEPYRELVYDGAEVPFLPLIYPDTVVCYSYSKSLSLPGERIGYVYVPRRAAEGQRLYAAVAGAARAMGHVCAPSLMQLAAAKCASLRPDLAAYDRNRLALYEGLTGMGYQAPRPQGAFYLFVRAPGDDAEAFSRRAREKDLLLVPGDSFGCPGYFRVCYCVDYEMIQNSLPVFRALLEEDRP